MVLVSDKFIILLIDQNVYHSIVEKYQIFERVLYFPCVNVIYFYNNFDNYFEK